MSTRQKSPSQPGKQEQTKSLSPVALQVPLLQSTMSQMSTRGDGVTETVAVATTSGGSVAEGVIDSVREVSGMSTSSVKTAIVLVASMSANDVLTKLVGGVNNTLEGSGRRDKVVSGKRTSSELVETTSDVSRGVMEGRDANLVSEADSTRLEGVKTLTERVSSEEGSGLSLLSTRDDTLAEGTGDDGKMADGKDTKTEVGVGKSTKSVVSETKSDVSKTKSVVMLVGVSMGVSVGMSMGVSVGVSMGVSVGVVWMVGVKRLTPRVSSDVDIGLRTSAEL